jgi:hypothetical protein
MDFCDGLTWVLSLFLTTRSKSLQVCCGGWFMEEDEGRSQTTIDVESTVDNEEASMSYQGYPMYLFVLNAFSI